MCENLRGQIARLCRLSLVAKNYEVRFGFVKSFCKTFCTFFVRMFVASVGAFPAFFYHYLYYSTVLCGFQCFGKVFFNLTAKMLRAQRNFDGVLMTYSFIYPWRSLRAWRFYCTSTPGICKKAIQNCLKIAGVSNVFDFFFAETGHLLNKGNLTIFLFHQLCRFKLCFV